jgi:hypothetical protein
MKAAGTLTALLLVTILAGCSVEPGAGGPAAAAPDRARSKDGLELSLSIPKARLRPGQHAEATVTAVNRSRQPITIPAASNAPVYLRLWRYTGYSWEQFKQLPEASALLMKPWRLEPGQKKDFPVAFEVTLDWPTAERLRMTAELNGRPDVRPDVLLKVEPQAPAGP